MARRDHEIEKLLTQLWDLLDSATRVAIAANVLDNLEHVASLCETAAQLARHTAVLHKR